MMPQQKVEMARWGTRIGLILAAAGNAVGIGNLLRFPSQAAQNGGGAFMIPYFVALILLGIPMMWVEWTIGRFGGKFGHGSTPGVFDKLWRSPIAKYLGIIGVAGPLVLLMYYGYLGSWMLGYSYLSASGHYNEVVDFNVYLHEYQMDYPTSNYFPTTHLTLICFLIIFLLNVIVLARGVAKGIELLAKIAMPLLFVFAAILFVRVLTLGWDKVGPGFAFIWNPDFAALGNPKVWLHAAGQIFFTLSIGMGALVTYASYLREQDDVVLTGLTTSATNEFVEVIFGGSIAIGAVAAFFGPALIMPIAKGGAFDIGIVAFPEILRGIGGVWFFGTIWFLLLFFAAFTSTVALAEPSVAFMQYELRLPRVVAVFLVGCFWFIGTVPVILFYRYGYLGELDFWIGTFFIVLFAFFESVLFAWIFGIKKGWEEMHKGCDIRVPGVYRFVMKFILPLLLLCILVPYIVKDLPTKGKIPARICVMPTGLKELKTRIDIKETKEAKELKQMLQDFVDRNHRDFDAAVTIKLAEKRHEVIPGLQDEFGKMVEEYVTKLKITPKLKKEEQGKWGEQEIVLQIMGLHRAPYIWLARVQILFFFLLFGVFCYFAWRGRK
jgi:SNF family Na+-dependent transporter